MQRFGDRNRSGGRRNYQQTLHNPGAPSASLVKGVPSATISDARLSGRARGSVAGVRHASRPWVRVTAAPSLSLATLQQRWEQSLAVTCPVNIVRSTPTGSLSQRHLFSLSSSPLSLWVGIDVIGSSHPAHAPRPVFDNVVIVATHDTANPWKPPP